jgi:predicted dehydrogenase
MVEFVTAAESARSARPENPMPSEPLNRRRFIQTLAAGSTAAYFLPAASYARVPGAGERIAFGVIGTGGMGTHHVGALMDRRERDNIAVLRVCDVYRRRLNNAVRRIQSSGAGSPSGGPCGGGTMEYREVLDDRDVDAIVIATPDHWHTKIAIEGMQAGKEVYCEKPLSLTVEQALACRDAAHSTGRVLQVGPQATSDDRYWKAQKAIREGRIGKVTWSRGSYCRNSRGGQFNWAIDPDAGPQAAQESDGYVWWDRWLGHEWGLAEKIAWNADHFFRFRKYFAYNGGVATDLLYHKLAPLLLAISGPEGEYPQRVSAAGGTYVEKDERDIMDTFMMTVDYPSEHTVLLVSVMTNDAGLTDAIHGQRGTMHFSGEFDTGTTGSAVTIAEQAEWWPEFREANAGEFPNRLVRDDKGEERPDPAPGQAAFDIHVSPRRDHMGNFIDAVRGSAKPNCNIDLGCATMVAIKMGVEAYRRHKTLLWDARREKVVES